MRAAAQAWSLARRPGARAFAPPLALPRRAMNERCPVLSPYNSRSSSSVSTPEFFAMRACARQSSTLRAPKARLVSSRSGCKSPLGRNRSQTSQRCAMRRGSTTWADSAKFVTNRGRALAPLGRVASRLHTTIRVVRRGRAGRTCAGERQLRSALRNALGARPRATRTRSARAPESAPPKAEPPSARRVTINPSSIDPGDFF